MQAAYGLGPSNNCRSTSQSALVTDSSSISRQQSVHNQISTCASPDCYGLQGWVQGAAKGLAALGMSAAIILQSLPVQAAAEVYRFPASTNPDVYAAQRTLLEAWSIVDQNFVDQSFAGHNWDEELKDALTSAYEADSGDGAYQAISQLLGRLKDPYTRIVRSKEYADFRVSSDGEVQGVGMLIAADTSGRLMVLNPLDGGPAQRAGVRSGDELVCINGHSVKGWDGDKAAVFLRGRSGSSVNIRLARRTLQLPGVAGRPDPPLYTEYRQVNLKREKLELSPVYSTALLHDDHKVGYIRLSSFSQKAAADMRRHINKLERTGAEALILDLRGNPGGLVRAGLDVARIFLDGPTTIFNVTGRSGGDFPAIAQKVILEDGPAETQLPLAVLVNKGSASASEILAGALHDNHRATVLGDTTYGKGKIQSVFELADGSALFVTVARYKTPNFTDIDQVGIKPDQVCRVGQDLPAGLPLDPETAFRVAQQLSMDSCVLAAEAQLEADLVRPQETQFQPDTHTWNLVRTAPPVRI